MKRFLLLLALLAACTAQAQRYTNPVLHLDYSDPDVCRVGDRYYMTASSFNCFPGLPILESEDLVHWELTGAALWDYEPAFREGVEHGNGVWAPAIRYHNGWFYIYVGDPDRGIFMVRSRNPRGRWSEPVWVVREKGFIDPCPFWDEDGKAYLSHGCAALFLTAISPSPPSREPSSTSEGSGTIFLLRPAAWLPVGKPCCVLPAPGGRGRNGL